MLIPGNFVEQNYVTRAALIPWRPNRRLFLAAWLRGSPPNSVVKSNISATGGEIGMNFASDHIVPTESDSSWPGRCHRCSVSATSWSKSGLIQLFTSWHRLLTEDMSAWAVLMSLQMQQCNTTCYNASMLVCLIWARGMLSGWKWSDNRRRVNLVNF